MSQRLTLSRMIRFQCMHRYEVDGFTEKLNLEHFGACYNQHGHGHTYRLVGYFEGDVDSETGMIINLKDVDMALKKSIEELRDRFLNEEVPEFKTIVPTTENIALYVQAKLKPLLLQHEGVSLSRLRLYETDDLWVDLINE